METLPDFGASLVPSETWEHTNSFKMSCQSLCYSKSSTMVKLKLLNITARGAERNNGHPSLTTWVGSAGPAPVNKRDYSHWWNELLFRVPDLWNELRFALLLKHEGYSRSNSGDSDIKAFW